MQNKAPSVLIIGGGWAGLAAAVDLSLGGSQVTLLESARQLGGRARTVKKGHWLLDNGQHILIGAYAQTLSMLQQVGVSPNALLRQTLHLEVPGKVSLKLPSMPAPFHLAAGLFFAKGPRWPEKWAAARLVAHLQKIKYNIEPDCSVQMWLEDNAQRGLLREHLWEPLCIAALNTQPAQASAQIFANVLRDTLGGKREATDFLLPRTDLSSLFPTPAQQFLTQRGTAIHCSERALEIEQAEDGWRVHTRTQNFSAEHLVLACAPQHAGALLKKLPLSSALQNLQKTLASFAYEPIATAYLQYPASLRLAYPLINLNDGLAQWLFDRSYLGGPPGLLAHVLSAHGSWQNMDDAELVMSLHRCHQRISPEILPTPHDWLVIREQKATFRCSPQLHRPDTDTGVKHFWLAGDYVASDYPGTLEAAVRSGKKAAHLILKGTSH